MKQKFLLFSPWLLKSPVQEFSRFFLCFRLQSLFLAMMPLQGLYSL